MSVGAIAVQCPSDSLGDVTQVAEERALVALRDFGVERHGLVIADCSQKVVHVLGIATATALLFFDQLVAQVEDAVAAVAIQFERTSVAIEGDETTAVSIAAETFPGDLTVVRKGESHRMGVRRFLVIASKMVAAATGVDLSWEVDVQSPATKIQGVHTIIPQLSVSPVPPPVPVVVHDIAAIGGPWRRALPEFVIELAGNIGWLAIADRPAGAVVPGPREVYAANDTSVQLLHCFDSRWPAAALGANLDGPAVFTGGLNHPLALLGVVATRFFDIDVFTCRAG